MPQINNYRHCLYILQKHEMRFRWAINKAIEYRKAENIKMEQKISKLRADILNSPSHILGEHKKCLELKYFCTKPYISKNTEMSDIRLTCKY